MTHWENKFIIFQVTHGPKVIIESLNTYGEEGWECCSMLVVAGSQICCFLKRRTDVDEPKVDKEEEKLSKLWSNSKE